MNRKVIRDYIETHKSTYQSKYKYHSSYQRTENIYKFHYYMRDAQLQQINIFFEIQLGEQISVSFAENLHEYEQIALTIDALEILERYIGQETKLAGDQLKEYIAQKEHSLDITNQDVINILNYLEYHQGTSQKTIDLFYEICLPYLEKLLQDYEYQRFVQAINMICDEILYEHFWSGINVNYMDQEYYFHLYYFRKIFELCLSHIEMLFLRARNEIENLTVRLFEYDRFTFCMISVLDDLECNKYIIDAIFSTLSMRFKLVKDNGDDGNLAYTYLYSFYKRDEQMQKQMRDIIFEHIVKDILTIDNHDMQIALGNYMLKTGGYDILIRLFKKDYNTYVFRCFPLDEIPKCLHTVVKNELICALKYYDKLMEKPEFRLGSLEQIMNINRLILEYFKEEIYGNQ